MLLITVLSATALAGSLSGPVAGCGAGCGAGSVAGHPSSSLAALAPTTRIVVDEISALIDRGKLELLHGDAGAAHATFTLANEKSGGALPTESWVLRAQIALGELDEAFDRIIDLESSGAKAIELDYVIGVARYEMARRAEGERGGDAGGAYQEAAAYLSEVTAAQPDGFPDAWKMLAASSRWVGDAGTALAAIERALMVANDGETLSLASKIRIAHGAAQMGDPKTKASGQRAIEQGVSDARAAAKAFGNRKKNAAALADIHLQRAVGLLFLERKGDAGSAYTDAMEWDPAQVAYAQLLNIFTDDDGTIMPFVELLAAGDKAYGKRWGEAATGDAGLVWWLGYGEYTLGRFDDAIGSFQSCLVKVPGYTNSHWYIALSQFFLGKEHDVEAAASFRAYAEADVNGFAAMVNSSADNKSYPGRVLGRLYGAGKLDVAADLAEVRLMADEADPLLWNDVGLMCRDAGEALARRKSGTKRKSADEYYERSWFAYQRAIELDRKPQYLNDGAVILHYYLDRDFDQAIAMYDEAEQMAEALLAEGGLESGERALVKIALRDSRNNRALLKKKIERRKKGGDGGR